MQADQRPERVKINTPTVQELLRYLNENYSKELTQEDRGSLEQLQNYEKIAKTVAIVYPITVFGAEVTFNKAYFKRLKGTNRFFARVPYYVLHLFNMEVSYYGYTWLFQRNQKKAINIAEKYDKDLYILCNRSLILNSNW